MSEPEKKSSFKPELFAWGVVVCLLGWVALVVIPNCVKPRNSPAGENANRCINNLREIDAAANEFALEHGKTNGDAINYPSDITPYIKVLPSKPPPSHLVVLKSPLKCPSGGIYSIKKVGEPPTCSIGTNVIPWHVLP
jgi:hypothetical protein